MSSSDTSKNFSKWPLEVTRYWKWSEKGLCKGMEKGQGNRLVNVQQFPNNGLCISYYRQ